MNYDINSRHYGRAIVVVVVVVAAAIRLLAFVYPSNYPPAEWDSSCCWSNISLGR